jgi:hypothetical protein
MSVLSCVRVACGSIMCETYVPGIGYVCTDCQREFKVMLQDNGYCVDTNEEIEEYLEEFLETTKPTKWVENNIVDKFFEKYTDED